MELPRPLIEALRALTPAIYLRVKESKGFVQQLSALGRSREPARRCTFFATTDPSGPQICLFPNEKQKQPDTDDRGPDILSNLVVCDPADDQALAIIQIPDGRSLEVMRDPLNKLVERRIRDLHCICQVLFVGGLPANQVVPDDLKPIVYPIDLVGESDSTAVDHSLPRKDAATDGELQELQKLFQVAVRLVGPSPMDGSMGDGPVVLMSEEQLALVRGMRLEEFNQVMSSSVCQWVMTGRESKVGIADRMLNPTIIDSYRNRWARVP